jgi:NAD+ synthase
MTLCDQRGDLLDTTDKTGLALGQGAPPGGFSVVADIWRGGLSDLARWRNAQPGGPVLPERLLAGADGSTDAILAGLVEEELDAGALALRGFDHATVLRLWRLVDRAEYKRRQAPPGVTLGHRAFGLDRRYPLTNGLTNLIP